MKIAMIGHKRIPGREGGVEVVVEELATGLVKKGHQVYVYNRKKRGTRKIKEYKGVTVITVPTIERKSTDAVVYSFFATVHAVFCGYDVIHYHALGPSVMLLLPHFLGIRTVVTVHGLNYKTPKWKGFGAKYIHWGEKITAKYADEIIVLSQEQQKYFQKKYDRETRFIPNGTTVYPIIKPKVISERWGLGEKKYVLFLSRIVPGKGLEHLLEAYAQIDEELPLVVAGASVYVDEFYTKIKNMAEQDSRVRLIGFVEGEILQELYSNAKLFVFPSEAEGMPMCLLEAMSYETPCLVSDISENMEVGKDYVAAFKVADVTDLRDKLKQQLKFPGNCRTNGSREYIEKNYEWSKVVDRTVQCYQGEAWH